jgi:hypothetical protein
MSNNSVTHKTRHEYYNQIYDDLHPFNDKEKRIYTKPKQNFDFFYRDDQLTYSKQKDLDFNRRSLENFKSFKDTDINIDKKTVQDKISFYLCNNIVPVNKLINFHRALIMTLLQNLKKNQDSDLQI